MNYNKKKQPFTIQGRFRILEENGEVEYCRVLFHNTGYEVNIPAGKVKSLEFEDDSLEGSKSEKATDEEIVSAINESQEKQELYGDTQVEITITDDIVEIKPVEVEPVATYIATNQDGEDFEIHDLEAFVAEHNLDMDAVEACLEGKQKTHKKWRFATV